MTCPECGGELNTYNDSRMKPKHKCFRCGWSD